VACCVLQGPAGAHEGADEAGGGVRPLFDRDRLTGDWWGARSRVEEAGLTIGAEAIAEFSTVFDGGIHQRGSFRGIFTLDAELDLGTVVGLEGGTVFAQFLSVNAERGGSLDAGDIQGYTNIENPYSINALYELWYEQRLLEERLRVKVGKVDANTEFAFAEAAGDFANSSAGFSPTIFVFPSYPDAATSVNVFGRIVDVPGIEVSLGYGLYDGSAAEGVRTGTNGPASVGEGADCTRWVTHPERATPSRVRADRVRSTDRGMGVKPRGRRRFREICGPAEASVKPASPPPRRPCPRCRVPRPPGRWART